ncbi:tyrosine-type recombinase/integrase [Lysinibacillus sphaericus]
MIRFVRTNKSTLVNNSFFCISVIRHTHATMLIESGQLIKTVQKRLGHSRSATTEDRYVHLTQKMARDAADIFDSIAKDL